MLTLLKSESGHIHDRVALCTYAISGLGQRYCFDLACEIDGAVQLHQCHIILRCILVPTWQLKCKLPIVTLVGS
jgi:hypothetical protein